MITVHEIRKQAERAYPEYLRSLVSGEPFFPFEVRFGKNLPKGQYHAFSKKREALLDGAAVVFEHAEAEGAASAAAPLVRGRSGQRHKSYVVELEGRNSRRYGLQMLPVRIYFDDEVGFTEFLDRKGEASRFGEAVGETRRIVPELLPWLERHAPRITYHLDEWEEIVTVCRYLLDHPRPQRFARELPIPVHTKFVEEHEGILRQLLDAVLPASAVDAGVSDFARRFGLRYDEAVVRMRALDWRIAETSGWPAEDMSLPVSALARLGLQGSTIVISENKMTFLTLPRTENAIGLFGGGFKIDVLRDVDWLRDCEVVYWGDLDAQGFIILSRLRSFLPETRSIMMDVETFETFRRYSVEGTQCDIETLPHLTPPEQALFQSLVRGNRRLEQERIPHDFVVGRLGISADSTSAGNGRGQPFQLGSDFTENLHVRGRPP